MPAPATSFDVYTGSAYKILIKLALPITTGMLFYFVYNITDTIWLSRIDLENPAYVGGPGLIFPIISIALALNNGLTAGVSSLVARARGSGDEAAQAKAVPSGLAIAAVISALMLGTGYLFGSRLITLLGAEADFHTSALEYLYFITPGAAGMFLASIFAGYLQGKGDMKTVMLSLLIGTGSNILLDPIFIFLCGWNVKGAGAATSLSQIFALLYLFLVFKLKHQKSAPSPGTGKIEEKTMRSILEIGIPQSLSEIVISMGYILTNTISLNIDPGALAGFTIASRTGQIIYAPINGIAVALLTLTGQNFGKGNFSRLKQVWQAALHSAFLIVFINVTILFFIAPRLFTLFSDVPMVVRYAVMHVRIIEYSTLFALITILGRSVYQGTGKGKAAFFIIITRLVVFAIPAILLFVYVFHWGIHGVLWGFCLGNILAGIKAWFQIEKELGKISAYSGQQKKQRRQ